MFRILIRLKYQVSYFQSYVIALRCRVRKKPQAIVREDIYFRIIVG